MTKSVAQMKADYAELEAQLAASQEETREARDAAKKAKQRVRWSFSAWPNPNRRTVNDPEHTGIVRMVVPPDLQSGDYMWVDFSLWIYNEETSPVHFAENPPEYNLSLSPTDPEYAEIKEEGRKEYFRQRAARESGAT